MWVLQKLGKTEETRDDMFEYYNQLFLDQQVDGNRIYKDLRNYVNAVRDMREASRRLTQSLFDVYENDWAGEEDLGAIVEGEDLLWNDYEVKLIDQTIHTVESYVSQFPDVKEKVSKRRRKLVDYDSSRHHLEALQTAKKRDDVKIKKAAEEVNYAKSVYMGINSELKQELPVLFDSRIGCYISVFSSISNLRETFCREMRTLALDLQNVMKELQAQHPDKVFAVKGIQRYGSLRRRTLMSPRAWKASFSEFHRSYSPKTGPGFSLKSPDKPRRSTLSRESSTHSVSLQSPPPVNPISEHGDPDAESNHRENHCSTAEEESPEGTSGIGLKSKEDTKQEEKSVKEEVPEIEPPAESDDKGEGERAAVSESSSELNNSCDSESLDLKLSAAVSDTLHIEETDGESSDGLKSSRLENGDVSGLNSDTSDLRDKDVKAEVQTSRDAKSTDV
ncbi:bridging integrator 2a [Cynoglossus semilaevis]|nr:bridging integrator 2 [Cynoglossus semilaevis]